MAKRKSVAKQAASAALIVSPEVGATVQIDQASVVAVAMHKAEVLLKQRLKETKAEIEAANRDVQAAQKRFIASLEDTFNLKYGEQYAALENNLVALGFKRKGDDAILVTHDVQAQHALRAIGEGKESYEASVQIANSYCSANVNLPFSAESKSAYEQLVAHRVYAQKASDAYLEFQNQLNSLPSLERAARANLAEKILQSTEAGQELLAAAELDLNSPKIRALLG